MLPGTPNCKILLFIPSGNVVERGVVSLLNKHEDRGFVFRLVFPDLITQATRLVLLDIIAQI